jgi:hypothetical protein
MKQNLKDKIRLTNHGFLSSVFLKLIFFVFFFFIFLVMSPGAQAATSIYNIQPTNLTPTTISISWTSPSAENSKVNYGTTTSYGSSATDATVATSHTISLTGLIPGTTYHYTVGNVAGSDVSSDVTFKTPYDWGLITANSNTGVDTSHVSDEYSKGVRFKTLELSWAAYETGNGVYDTTYINAKKAELAAYQAQGFQVILDIGSHYPADWVAALDANTFFKNQYGDTYQPASPGKNIVNAVFNNTVRSAISTYIKQIFSDFGTNFYAVRAGGLWYGELHYPTHDYNGRTNSYWGYDANAQGTGGNLPSGVDANPVSGWIPNPIVNGTFENGTSGSGWTLSLPYDSIITSGGHRGNNALQKVNPGAWLNVTSQTVQVVPGRTYNFSGWLKSSVEAVDVCIQILKVSDMSQLGIACTNQPTYTSVTGTFTPTENTVIIFLNANNSTNATLTYDDILITDSGHSYDAAGANATAFWNWYRDSLINYQNWQVAQYRTTGFNGRIYMLYPSYGVRPDADVDQITQAIGYDLSQTTNPSINGELQQDSDFYDEIAGLVDSQNNIFPYCTWLDMATANDTSTDKGDWSPAKYISTLATNNNRVAFGENAGSNAYIDMQRMINAITANNMAGGFWFDEPHLYGGIYATAANYQTQILANDTTAPYNLSLNINSNANTTLSQNVTLSISATDNVSPSSAMQMIISDNSDFSGASYESFTASKSYELSSGEGIKIIYLKVKDESGNESNIYQDRVTYSAKTASSSSSDSSLSSSSPPAPSCGDTVSSGTPDLFQIDTNSSQAVLYFTPVNGSVTGYFISYGLSPGKYQYGTKLSSGASTGVLSYTINYLSPNTTYYFKVLSSNGCASGNWSNEMNAKTTKQGGKGGISYYKNFQSRRLSIFPKQITTLNPTNNPVSQTKTVSNTGKSCEYIVQRGDTLWKIASKKLGSGKKYPDIINSNKGTYSSLSTSNILRAGWKLKVGCN